MHRTLQPAAIQAATSHHSLPAGAAAECRSAVVAEDDLASSAVYAPELAVHSKADWVAIGHGVREPNIFEQGWCSPV